jgi:hypothetical protein
MILHERSVKRGKNEFLISDILKETKKKELEKSVFMAHNCPEYLEKTSIKIITS